MGIGNSTSAAAIISVFSGEDIEKFVGRGTGVTDETLKKKNRRYSKIYFN